MLIVWVPYSNLYTRFDTVYKKRVVKRESNKREALEEELSQPRKTQKTQSVVITDVESEPNEAELLEDKYLGEHQTE